MNLDRMWALFERSVALDTSPGAGNHRVASDDPRLRAFIDKIAAPELQRLGAQTVIDGMGNMIATFGERTGTEFLFVVYPANHHANRMDDPLQARVITVDGRTYWCGQGASEGKGPFVALLEALRLAQEDGAGLDGRVMVAINTEGSSTNESSAVMFAGIDPLPAAVVLVIGTENQIALGHRGRADVIVTTTGIARHSSVAAGGPNPIDQIAAAQQRVKAFADAWAAREPVDPQLARSITPYRLVCGPIAPHTLPERCELALDCRFLPGDDVDDVLRGVKNAIDDANVDVRFGPVMLPARTSPGSTLVRTFLAAGEDLVTYMPPWTFDAGAAASLGVPVILFGPSSNNLDAIDAADAVAVDMLTQACETYHRAITSWPAE